MRNLIVGEGGVGHLAGIELHLLLHGKAELHHRRAGELGLDDARVDRPTDVSDIDQFGHPHVAGLGIDFDLGAGGADHPERVALGVSPFWSGGT